MLAYFFKFESEGEQRKAFSQSIENLKVELASTQVKFEAKTEEAILLFRTLQETKQSADTEKADFGSEGF